MFNLLYITVVALTHSFMSSQELINMDSCVNCKAAFDERAKGYRRYSLEKEIPTTGKPARLHVSEITKAAYTPVSKKTEAKFLCAVCWSSLNETVKYNRAMEQFFGNTASDSYIASKRGADTSFQTARKKPRFTSTPLKVRIHMVICMRKTYVTFELFFIPTLFDNLRIPL